MSWTARLLILLYPPKWRRRYEAEFAALLEDMGPLSRHLPDLFWGAMKMQMKEWGFLRLALAFGAVGLLVAVGFQLVTPERFVSKSVAHIGDIDDLADRETQVLSRHSLSQIIQDHNLYQSERDRNPLEDVIEAMRSNDIRIRSIDSNTFQVEFAYSDAATAQSITTALTTLLTSRQSGMVVRGASLPSEPEGRSRSLVLSIGIAAGTVLGLLLWGVFQLTPRTRSLLAAFGAGGALLFFAGSYLIPEVYVSSTVMRAADKGVSMKRNINDDHFAHLINRLSLYGGDQNGRIAMDTLIPRFRDALKIEKINPPGGHDTVRISFSYSDRQKTQQAVQALITIVMEQNAVAKVRAEVLDNASLPESPVSPNREILAAFGLGLGLLTGALLAKFKSGGRKPQPTTSFPVLET